MQSKGVYRYRPGKLPKYAEKPSDEEAIINAKLAASSKSEDRRLRRAAERGGAEQRQRRPEAAVVYVAPKSESIKKETKEEAEEEDRGDRRLRARGRPEVAEVVSATKALRIKEEPKEEEEEKESLESLEEINHPDVETKKEELDEEKALEDEERRRRLKERSKQIEEEEELAKGEEEADREEGEEGDSDEWETDTSDSEDEYNSRRPTITPTFVKKDARETLKEKEDREKAEADRAKAEEARKTQRQEISRQLLIEQLKREYDDVTASKGEGEEGSEEEDELELGEDEEDEEAEYEKWKVRELRRIKRDQEEKLAYQQELEEIERRRKLTDSEIVRLEPDRFVKEKTRWNFLQKYYHKGAFYQDDPLLGQEDFEAPTLEDKIDKSILPKVMQRKNFGRAGQTKWTHLLNEDTSVTNKNIILNQFKPKPTPKEDDEGPSTSTSEKKDWSGGFGDEAPPPRTFAEYRDDHFDPWKYAPQLKYKYMNKMGGMGAVDDPLGRKKRKRSTHE